MHKDLSCTLTLEDQIFIYVSIPVGHGEGSVGEECCRVGRDSGKREEEVGGTVAFQTLQRFEQAT